MSERTILVWFRNDLRIRDNEILLEACKKAEKIVPVYCFDPRNFAETSFNTKKTGNFRAKFLIESVRDLKESLRSLGADLMVVDGKPEERLPQIAQEYNVAEVYHHREVALEETEISALVETALWKLQINLKHFIGHTLYHKEDLPFPIKDIPDTFATFRKKIERESEVRQCFNTPAQIKLPAGFEPGIIPALKDLGLEEPLPNAGSIIKFIGGETEGLKRIEEFFGDKSGVNYYKSAKNSLIAASFSSRLSPWLSLGCLSTRQVYWEIKRYEKQNRTTNAGAKLAVEFLWRDYFRFMYKKHGGTLSKNSVENVPVFAGKEKTRFEKWKSGETGVPLIDACMRELNQTGFISNPARQVVSNYLIKNLGLNREWGEAYFEEKLIDHSPASNRGNWAMIGIPISDSKEKRNGDILNLALELDPQGEYVRKWVPELAPLPGNKIHSPWLLTPQQQSEIGITPNCYPKPLALPK